MSFVLDASLTLSWFFEDEKSDYAEAVKASLHKTEAVVPYLWHVEVANALMVAERRERVPTATVERAAEVLQRLPIHVDRSDPPMPALIKLARTHDLTAYDAIYLHLAIEKALPIASFDRRLNDACNKAGVARFLITERDGANDPNRGT